mmetsp:Transcript_50609/g.80623  ORF Transcript_50609/g.80623 Transcript_50609/m.80623 type:complete len:219 (-) Transcript_50609:597-1253(-)|eukprot:CAMPEP_0197025048 /NCGR_PEP_ID=MMETSP1384-20130603/5486_1 /TAXON_ID=29189 /ORGANISM="Ammonia sp." /LENGTH=218 /DNA_ID=CAMNT_0042453533 /DNA_START=71 /DNA_END=727 /DNA_ORIENTATION=+
MLKVEEEDIELQQLIHKAMALLDNIKLCKSYSERDSLVEKCETHLKQCKNLISRIEIETRDMDTDERAEVRQILKERAAKLKELKTDLKWAKNDQSLQANQQNLEEEQKYDNLEEMNEDELIQYAERIQQEDMRILDNVILDIDQTKATAENTAVKVAEQTEQIGRVSAKLDDIDDELERAKRVLLIMIRRVMTDKLIWFFLMLVMLALLVIVVLTIM